MVAVLDYGIGNLRSAERALEHCGAEAHLTADPKVVGRSQAVVLPGVGENVKWEKNEKQVSPHTRKNKRENKKCRIVRKKS